MTDVIHVEICAPEHAKAEMDAVEVMCPGEDGIFTVRYGHTPMLTTLIAGLLLVKDTNGTEHYFAVSGGFAEIEKERVLVLADTVESDKEIDLERARAAESRAESRLKRPEPETDLHRAEQALYRSLARINASSHNGY